MEYEENIFTFGRFTPYSTFYQFYERYHKMKTEKEHSETNTYEHYIITTGIQCGKYIDILSRDDIPHQFLVIVAKWVEALAV